jgi:hypothetical protein
MELCLRLDAVQRRRERQQHTWMARKTGQWPTDSVSVRWRAVAEPPHGRRTSVGTCWPGHAAMGRRGPLASGPCHFSDFFMIFHLQNFEIQNGDFPAVYNSQNFA